MDFIANEANNNLKVFLEVIFLISSGLILRFSLSLTGQNWVKTYQQTVTNSIEYFIFTPADIPIVISTKNITSSNALLTGFLKRTIDSAPTIPNESAIFPLIVITITYVATGKIKKVTVCW